MTEVVKNGVFSVLKGSPIAVALLVMFWMGNSYVSRIAEINAGAIKEMSIDHAIELKRLADSQTIINERVAKLLEELTKNVVELRIKIESFK